MDKGIDGPFHEDVPQHDSSRVSVRSLSNRMTADSQVLNIEQLTISTVGLTPRREIVDRLDLTVGASEFVALVGESGCGKSMVCHSISRLLPQGVGIESGSIQFMGRDLTSVPASELRELRGRDFSTVFQDPLSSLNPTMRIGAQVMEPILVHKLGSKREAINRVLDLLHLVGFARPRELIDAYPYELSGGMRQRAAIAMALACVPKLLIADEPTTALDATVKAQVIELLKKVQSQLGVGVLFVSHDLRVVSQIADRITVMYAGKEVESGETREIMERPRHPYTSVLLGCAPEIAISNGTRLQHIPGMVPDHQRMPHGCRFHPRCLFAEDTCISNEPPLQVENGRRWSCWNPLEPSEPLVSIESIDSARFEEDGKARNEDAGIEERVSEASGVSRVFRFGRKGVVHPKFASVVAVDDVSIHVNKGETLGIVGESGSGKSTLGRMLIALEKPDDGKVRFGGVELNTLGESELRRRRMSFQMMFQDPYSSLDRHMKIADILIEPLVIHGIGSAIERERAVVQILDRVELSSAISGCFPNELSGGQRQRVGLARALMLDPELIVADEPVSALDVSVQAKILNLMRDLQVAKGLSYVFISHDLAVVRYMASRIAVMFQGRIVETGKASSIYDAPLHPYTKELLAAVNGKLFRRTGPDEVPNTTADVSRNGCLYRRHCPFADELCTAEVPILKKLDHQREVACHHPILNLNQSDETI